MQIDLDRWRRLLAAAADAEHDGPTFVDVQAANGRWQRARDELARFKAAGPTGRASGRPIARARAGEEIRPGIGGHDLADVARAYEGSVRELEAREGEAEREAKRLADRMRVCGERRSRLQRLVEEVRRDAAQQRPPVVLPGDDNRLVPPAGMAAATRVHIAPPPPGTPNFARWS